jgi:menaquinol-cytochrome c reductase iron-sulfur subunit
MDKPGQNKAPSRRGFMLGLMTVFTGILALLTPLVGSIAFVLSPVLRGRGKSKTGFVKVGVLASLPIEGLPRKFTVLADKEDAWNRYSNVPTGSVYLRRTSENKVIAFNIICPHAGCFVQVDALAKQFSCPCHNSQFKLDGSRANTDSPSPRDMDPLKVEIRNDEEIWVQYQRFKPGVAGRIPIG